MQWYILSASKEPTYFDHLKKCLEVKKKIKMHFRRGWREAKHSIVKIHARCIHYVLENICCHDLLDQRDNVPYQRNLNNCFPEGCLFRCRGEEKGILF